MSFKKTKKINGFSLIEVLISVFIVSSLIVTVFSLITYSLNVTTDNKFRLAALMLAEQKMEYVRSLPYNSVGLQSGWPVGGVIPDQEAISNNNGNFTVDTTVIYIDDPYDGTENGVPDDDLPTDYKKVSIKVSWTGPRGEKSITTFTNIAPRGMETSAGGGTLQISVFNASGTPISLADVHIENNNFLPPLSYDDQTDANGILNIPGATSSIEAYEITVTKGLNYSTDYTSERNATNTNPTKPHASVLDDQKTEISFAIDKLSDLIITTVTADLPNNWRGAENSSYEQENARIAIDNSGNIYTVWQDQYQTSGNKPEIMGQKYNDDGEGQWPNSSTPVDVRIDTSADTVIPDIKLDSSGNLYCAWSEQDGNSEVYLTRLSNADGSRDWGPSFAYLSDANEQINIRLAILEQNPNSTTTVVWQDDRNTDWDLFIQEFSNTNGAKLFKTGNPISTNEIRVSSNSSNQIDPAIASDSNDNFYITWTDDRNGNYDIFWKAYNPIGTQKFAEKRLDLDLASGDQYSAEIAIDSSDNIYVVWADERNGDSDIYIQKFDTSGTAQWGSDLKVNTDTSSEHQYSPSLAIDSGDNITVVWTDERNGNQDIYGQKFNSLGNPIWPEDVLANMNMDSSNQYNPYIAINPVDDNPFVTWQGDQDGDLNIYISNFGEYTGETVETGVPIHLHGAKKVGENPVIYKFDENFDNTTGTITLNNIEWDSYTASATDRTIILTDPFIPVYLEPNSSVTLKIYVE